jgi:hypothetical protein
MSKKEIINLLKTAINIEGFINKPVEQGVYWLNNDIDRECSLYIGFNGSLGRYFLQTPFASIRFHKIEDKIIDSSKELGIVINETGYTIKNKSLENNDFNYSIFESRIDNKQIFDEVIKSEKHYIQKSILPFFEKYQDLNNVAELLSRLKPQEVVSYIQGAMLFSKTILILKETNHPSYKKKRDEYYEVLKKQETKKDVYKQQLQLFESLFFTSPS